MALGDGTTWNETVPTNDTVANQIDDYMRDMLAATRSRMAREHVWPSSQTATSQAGIHTFITFQPQTGAPTLSTASSQVGAIYVGTDNTFNFVNSAGTVVQLVNATGAKATRSIVWYIGGEVETGAGQSAKIRVPVGGVLQSAYAYLDVSNTGAALLADINYDGTTIFTTAGNRVTIADGTTVGSAGAITVATFTAGGIFTLDIDQVGSAVAGTDLSIVLNFVET